MSLKDKDKAKKRNAEVAELADAHGSGPCGSNTMRVQVPPPALVKKGLFPEGDRLFAFPGGSPPGPVS